MVVVVLEHYSVEWLNDDGEFGDGFFCFEPTKQVSNRGIMDEGKKRQVCGGVAGDHADALSSASSEVSSVVSFDDSDLFDEVNSPTSQASDSLASSSGHLAPKISGPLLDLSSLLQELPFKRGLSKHYSGKSQSFTSLANVRSLEDLEKPENPCNKKLKSCKSHGLTTQLAARGNSSRLMSKKASRGSRSSLCVKRNSSFIANRPPIPPPHRSTSATSFAPQTPLFALGV